MTTINQLKNENKKLTNSKKYAWGKYYGLLNENLENQTTRFIQMNNFIEYIPTHIKDEYIKMVEELKKEIECPVCLTIIDKDELKISNCGHKYCKNCYDELVNRENKCCLCRKKLQY